MSSDSVERDINESATSDRGLGTSHRQRLGLIAVGLSLALVLLELGLRAGGAVYLWRQEQRNLTSLGRGTKIRVLCLGESTTAFGGDDAYPSQLEGILNQRASGSRFSVINKGIPATNTTLILRRLERLLDRFDPHVVVTMMGINDRNHATPVDANSGELMQLGSSLRIYKLAVLLWMHSREVLWPAPEAEPPATSSQKQQPPAPPELAAKLSGGLKLFAEQRFEEIPELFEDYANPDGAEPSIDRLLRETDYALATQYAREGQFNAAETALNKALKRTPEHELAYAYSRFALFYQAKGDREVADDYFRRARSLRSRTINPTTQKNYRALRRILNERGIPLVAVQYPLRSVEALERMLGPDSRVSFVDNEVPFRRALERTAYDDLFTDAFAGDFGHTTAEGSRLLANQVAEVIVERLSVE